MTTTKKTTTVKAIDFTTIENLEKELKKARLEAKKQDKKAYQNFIAEKSQAKKLEKEAKKENNKARHELVLIRKELKKAIVENNKQSSRLKKSIKSIQDIEKLIKIQNDLMVISEILKGWLS